MWESRDKGCVQCETNYYFSIVAKMNLSNNGHDVNLPSLKLSTFSGAYKEMVDFL